MTLNDFEKDYENIAEYGSEIATEELLKNLHDETEKSMLNYEPLLQEIKILIDKLIINIKTYQDITENSKGINIIQAGKNLRNKRRLIYDTFFKLQNKINLFLGQKIIITYVHIDEFGRRQIRLYDNDISHLSVNFQRRNAYFKSKPYAKLAYDFDEHYKILKNTLPEEENYGLQRTAEQVTERYYRYRRSNVSRIMWKINNTWYGYRIFNMGPINEAFASFYIHNIKFDNSESEENIHYYMLDRQYGVIAADNANGFLLGDTSLGKLQFAVKGKFGSPQGYSDVLKFLYELKNSNFSTEGFQRFVQSLKDNEQEKATSLIKPMSKKSIKSMLRYHTEEKLLQPLISKIDIYKNLT